MAVNQNLKRGTVYLMILTLLCEEDMFGYQIIQTLQERSEGYYLLEESTIYPSLYRLEGDGYISSLKRMTLKGRERVYYHIEPKGREYCRLLRKEYVDLNYGVLCVLQEEARFYMKHSGKEQEEKL